MESNPEKNNMEKVSVILPSEIPLTYPNKVGILALAATNINFSKYKHDQSKWG
jgi:hypothetical protein